MDYYLIMENIDTLGLPDWRVAIIVPTYKKDNQEDPVNYRPISLLSIVSKLYAKQTLDMDGIRRN